MGKLNLLIIGIIVVLLLVVFILLRQVHQKDKQHKHLAATALHLDNSSEAAKVMSHFRWDKQKKKRRKK